MVQNTENLFSESAILRLLTQKHCRPPQLHRLGSSLKEKVPLLKVAVGVPVSN